MFLALQLTRARQIREMWKRVVDEVPAQPWSETFKVPGRRENRVFDANSWAPFRLFPVPGASDQRTPDPKITVFSPSKRWGYDELILPRAETLSLCTGVGRTHVVFNGDVVIPRLHEFHEDGSHKELWMSYTPQEVATLRPGLRKAKGAVVIGGLGMGWLLTRVLQKKNVNRVWLVEQSQELCDWILPLIKERVTRWQYNKLTVTVGDAKELIPKTHADVALWDIWETLGHVDHEDEAAMQQKCPNIKTTWFWGASAKIPNSIWD